MHLKMVNMAIYFTIMKKETDSLYPHVLMFMLLCDHCIPMS